MAGMYGADVEQLRLLSQRLDEAGGQLDNTVAVVSEVVETVAWFGPDAEGFRDEWGSSHLPTLRGIATGLAEASRKVADNADDQERTSGDYGGSGPGTGGGGTGHGGSDSGSDSGSGTGVPTADDPDLYPDWLADIHFQATWSGLASDTFEGMLRSNPAGWADALGVGDDFARLGDDFAQLGSFGRAAQGLSSGLGLLGVGLGAFQTIDGIAEGNGWQVADGLINTGLGVAALAVTAATPAGWVVLGAGAVWAGAGMLATHLGYESTSEMFVDAGEWARDGIVEGAEAAWDGVEEAAGAVAGAAEALADGAGSVVGTVKGWF